MAKKNKLSDVQKLRKIADVIDSLFQLKTAADIATFLVKKGVKVNSGYTSDSCPIAAYLESEGFRDNDVGSEMTIINGFITIQNNKAIDEFIANVDNIQMGESRKFKNRETYEKLFYNLPKVYDED